MNRTLKFAVVAAVSAMAMTSQAHAAFTLPAGSTGSGSMFLYAFEDRGLNPTATNSAIFDLGLTSAFDTGSNQTFDLSSNSAWTSYIATIANPANVHWGVFGAVGTGGIGSSIFTTLSVVPASIGGSTLSSADVNYVAEMQLYGGTSGLNVATKNDLADAGKWGNTAGALPATLTTGLGSSMDFYKYVSKGTKATSLATQTAFVSSTGAPDYFTLSNTGVLSYTATAPVPEADTYAMMLAGLGLVGFMVRRRKAA